MNDFNTRAFNPQPEPPGDLHRFASGFDPQPEPPRVMVGLLLPAVQA